MLRRLVLALVPLGLFVQPAISQQFPPAPPFKIIDRSYDRIAPGAIELTNMPPIGDQGGLGLCAAFVSATMLTAENCRRLSADCTKLEDNQRFSALDLSRFKRTDDDRVKSELRTAYRGLDLEGGSPHDKNFIVGLAVHKAANEACVSIERITSKMRGASLSNDEQAKRWSRLIEQYQTYRRNPGNAALQQAAISAIDAQVVSDLVVGASAKPASEAVKQEDVDGFFDVLLGAIDCRRPTQLVAFEGQGLVKYESAPKRDRESPSNIKKLVRSVLATGRPAALANICLVEGDPWSCPLDKAHSLVITGARTLCDKTGKCRDSLKVANSWGEAWQRQYADGWLDADILLAHTKIAKDTLGWFADKETSDAGKAAKN